MSRSLLMLRCSANHGLWIKGGSRELEEERLFFGCAGAL